MSYRYWQDPEYIKWRKAVYRRDKWTCQWPDCGKRKKLRAHHIKKWADYPTLRFLIDNGITLCEGHHRLIEGREIYYEHIFMRFILNKKKK